MTRMAGDEPIGGDLSERVDRALEALWQGRGDVLDSLVSEADEGKAGAEPAMGRLISEVLRDLPPLSADSSELGITGYEVVDVLGRGGMGTVFAARQQQPNRLVALKVVSSASADDPYRHKLFDREVESLARLKHPSIASIFEAGRTRDGRQFFAMELVEGQSLRAWLGQESSDPSSAASRSALRDVIRHRLRLFHDVCEAVHYAHQRGVIHRDLKPSNIMIDRSGRPRILDFGLARLTDSDVTLATGAGDTGKLLGTLAYMSPEQARADTEHVDVRTDVYSLGVLLYEMLTGRLPYDVGALPHHAVQVICQQTPSRPSALVRGIDTDLETIALKALEKEPSRRYQSALALGEDIDRYLADQPILARPPSAAYQLRKIVARHRAFASLATVFVVMSLAFGVVTNIQSRHLREQRDLALEAGKREATAKQAAQAQALYARSSARRADRAVAFLREMLSSADPHARGRDVSIRELLDEAEQSLAGHFADEPMVRAEVRDTLGMAYAGLGLYDLALRQLDDALATAREALGEASETTARVLAHRGDVLWQSGNLSSAEADLQAALSRLRDLPEADPLTLAETLNSMGLVLKARTRLDEAQACLQEALLIADQETGPVSEPVAIYTANLGLLLQQRGLPSAAEPYLRQSLAMRRSLVAAYGAHPAIATGLNNLGGVLLEQQRLEEAEALWREALEIRLVTLGDSHPSTATSCNNLAELYRRMGAFNEARCFFDQALEIGGKAWGTDHPKFLAFCYNYGVFLTQTGHLSEAEDVLARTLEARRRVLGDQTLDTVRSLEALGQLALKNGACPTAILHFDEAYRTKLEILGPSHPGTVVACGNLARVHLECGDPDTAEDLYRLGLLYDAQRAEPNPIERAQLLVPCAKIVMSRGSPEEAEALLEEALTLRRDAATNSPSATAETLMELGACQTRLHRFPEAERSLLDAYTLLDPQQTSAEAQGLLPRIAQRLTELYTAWNRPELAADYADWAAHVVEP